MIPDSEKEKVGIVRETFPDLPQIEATDLTLTSMGSRPDKANESLLSDETVGGAANQFLDESRSTEVQYNSAAYPAKYTSTALREYASMEKPSQPGAMITKKLQPDIPRRCDHHVIDYCTPLIHGAKIFSNIGALQRKTKCEINIMMLL